MQEYKVLAEPVNRNEGHFSPIKKHAVPNRLWAPRAVTGDRTQLRVDKFFDDADFSERWERDRSAVTGFVPAIWAQTLAKHDLNTGSDLGSGVHIGWNTNIAMRYK